MTPERRRARRALLFALAGALVFASAGGDPVAADEAMSAATIPLRFHVVEVGGRSAKGPEWISEQIQRANQVFAPTGLSFASAGVQPLDGSHAVLETRNDRNQLARYLERGVVNVFVVHEMVDVDNRQEWRRGVHWRLRWQPSQHYLVLTGIAPPTTLAHELGHFFGNRRHRWVPGNIMSYEHGESPTFDPDQLRRVEHTARDLLRRRQLFTMGFYRSLVREGRLPAFYYPPSVRHPDRREQRASR